MKNGANAAIGTTPALTCTTGFTGSSGRPPAGGAVAAGAAVGAAVTPAGWGVVLGLPHAAASTRASRPLATRAGQVVAEPIATSFLLPRRRHRLRRLGGAPGEQPPHSRHGRATVVGHKARGQQRGRVASEEALVQHLAAGEAAARQVPGQAEQ